MDILFRRAKYCSICGGRFIHIDEAKKSKQCAARCGMLYISDDCTNTQTACFEPADFLFIEYVTTEAIEGSRIRVLETKKEYATLRLCAEDIGGHISAISECVRGLRRSHHGFHFERVE
jgi:hypothetical protein